MTLPQKPRPFRIDLLSRKFLKAAMHKNSRLAFVAGKMVSAIVRSLLSSDFYIAQNLICCSANDGTSEKLSQQTGIRRAESIEKLLSFEADILILGCKPQQLGEIANQFFKSPIKMYCIIYNGGDKSRTIVKIIPTG